MTPNPTEGAFGLGGAKAQKEWYANPEQTDWTESGEGRIYRGIVVKPRDAGEHVGFGLQVKPDEVYHQANMTVRRRPHAGDNEPLTVESYEQAVKLRDMLNEMIQQADAYTTKAALSEPPRGEESEHDSEGAGDGEMQQGRAWPQR